MGKFRFSSGKISVFALLFSLGIIGIVALFKQPSVKSVFATAPDQCNQIFTYTKNGLEDKDSDEGVLVNDSRVNITLSDYKTPAGSGNDGFYKVSVNAKTGYEVTSVKLTVDHDGHGDLYEYATTNITNFDPPFNGSGNDSNRITKLEVKVKMVCGKVNICHKDGNSGNFNTLRIDQHAGIWQGGHSGHSGDFLYGGSVNADSQPTDNAWCGNNQPGDQCSNIDGKQNEIPSGKIRGEGNTCVNPPVDVCPNDEGIQTSESQCTPPPPDCGENQYESGGQCVNKTPVCTDPAANNDVELTSQTYSDNANQCTYDGHPYCLNNETITVSDKDIENENIPDGATEGACVQTPPVFDACPNLEGVQSSIPDGYHVDQAGGTCNQFQFGGPPPPPPAGGEQVLGASTSQGKVLGASTMAGAGTFTENLYMAIMGIGGTLTAFGLKNFKKASKKA